MPSDKKILITGAGGDIGQSVIKCLQDTCYGRYLVGVDVDIYAASRENVEIFFQSPWAHNVKEYKEFIEKLVRDQHLHYIIPTTEPEILFFNQYRTHFEDKVTLLINSSRIIDTFSDKLSSAEFFKSSGLLYPRTYLLEEYNGEIEFPVLLKQRRGCGARGMVVANDDEELSFLKKRNKDMIAQEIIGQPDEEYTVGVFSTGEKIYTISFQRYLGYGSLSKIAKIVQDPELAEIAENIAKIAGLVGAFNIQFRKTDKGYVPFEVNPRFSSTVYIRHYFGFRDVQWWLDMLEDKKIEYSQVQVTGVGVRRLDEVFFDCEPSKDRT